MTVTELPDKGSRRAGRGQHHDLKRLLFGAIIVPTVVVLFLVAMIFWQGHKISSIQEDRAQRLKTSQAANAKQDAAIARLTKDSDAYRQALANKGVNPNTVAPPPSVRLLVGPEGSIGPQGVQGLQGQPGLPGHDGLPGPAGSDGATGPAGPQGPAGKDGLDGKDGKDGKDGQDGAPGPTCPSGYSATPETFVTTDGPVTALVCVAN